MLNAVFRDIPERDWKSFRDIHPVARARFCERVLSEIASASSAPGQSAHERYLQVFGIVRDKDKELAMLFDNPRRSNALAQLSAIASAGLVTDEELSRFSPETRKAISVFATPHPDQALEPAAGRHEKEKCEIRK
jgi:hypothetical protein